ncbi:MAG: potassium channel family protein [Methylophilus sp.]|jgi:voltage-gated potassium channel
MSKLNKTLQRTTDTFRELFLGFALVLCTSAVLYSIFEHKKLWDGLWWAMVTAMTVGYGDTYPTTAAGRIVGIILMMTTVLFIIPLITARLSSRLIVNDDAFTHKEQQDIKNGIQDIKKKLDIK